MNQKSIIAILIGVFIIISGTIIYLVTNKNINSQNPTSQITTNSQNNQPAMNKFNPDFSGPPTIIYKTKGDYFSLMPVLMSEDKTIIVGYPDIKDIYYQGKISYPTRLKDGYLLDNRGLSRNSAFLNITYEEYAKLSKTPTSVELEKMIIDGNPFVEIFDCGNRYQFGGDNEIDKINLMIDSGQLSKCKSLFNLQ